jgi:endonuclease/exonuclease/phosphatase family metal-dependent hydrolase
MRKFLIINILIFISIYHSPAQNLNTFSVMSWNIRLDTPHDGINAWSYRKADFCTHLNKEGPDLIGFQEVLHNQLIDIQHCLDGFAFVGVGRADGLTAGEYSPVFFRLNRFELLDSGTSWLSETPERPGSVGWDAALERIVSWAKLIDRQSGDTILVFNTHFDHVGQKAREHSAALIIELSQKLAALNPVIIMGDFNATPENPVYHHFIASGFGDTRTMASKTDALMATYSGFDFDPKNDALIDFILCSKHVEVLEYQVQAVNSGSKFLSDHLPVVAKLTIKR